MTNDGILFVNWFFTQFWRFFNAFKIPGTNMTPAAFLIGSSVIILALKFILSVVSGIRVGTLGDINRAGRGLDSRSQAHFNETHKLR